MNRFETAHDDKALAARILAGDEAASRQLFNELFPRLYRFAMLRLDGNCDDACDAVQHTYCRAFEQLERYRGEASLFGWMSQICRNAITDLGRYRQHIVSEALGADRDTAIESILEAFSAPIEDEPEAQALRTDLIRLMQCALDRLPSHYGDVLEWKYVDGLALNEIAQRLELGPKAAESLLGRARAAFRAAMALVAGPREDFPEWFPTRRN